MSASIASGGTDIGRRVREQRERAGLSRAETAERAGLTPQYLIYLETSPDCSPTQATLIRLAAALGTSVSAFSGAGLNVPPGQRGAAVNPVLASLSAAECRTLVAQGGVGRLLFVEPDRGPVAVPVNYRMDGDDVVFRTGGGTRLADSLRRQANVSFDVDHLDEALGEGWSVLLTGTASVMTEPAEFDRVHSLGIEPWAGGDRQEYVRLRVHQVTGRAIRVTG
jgi:nitroimidazol reductase NimA-like FMN-containing flavoprotein (pyridoxamine 5'-phosphate oxidase superfamily)/DNA-binding XRE family transcriptional regulator